jgi:hypothetical protein
MVAVTVVLTLAAQAGPTRADDKPNPTGTWKWEVNFGGQPREVTLKLKLEDDKLTGAMVRQDGSETKIEDGKFKQGEVSFMVTRERDGQKFVMKFSGKVSGDTITGKSEVERDGQTQSREWKAKREKS